MVRTSFTFRKVTQAAALQKGVVRCVKYGGRVSRGLLEYDKERCMGQRCTFGTDSTARVIKPFAWSCHPGREGRIRREESLG